MKFANARELDRKSGCTLGRTLRGIVQGRGLRSFFQRSTDSGLSRNQVAHRTGIGETSNADWGYTN
jgi:hypothetical protein